MGLTLLTTILVFLSVVLSLVSMLLFAKSQLSPGGLVKLKINGEKEIQVDAGSTILSTLSNNKIFLPSACGGGGTCAMCKCQVNEGGGEILPTEKPYFSRKEINDNWRLGCQVKIKNDMNISIPEEVFGIKKWECEVISNYNVATFIKALVVKLPEGENLNFEAGGYIQIDVPETKVNFNDIDISPDPSDPAGPNKFKSEWDKFKLWNLKMKNDDPIFRAYSMANHPAEGNIVMLTIRIATPPWDRSLNNWLDVNPGICSSYIFTRKPGDKVTISGPYGEFFIKNTDAEMVYIGGGAGMAPMRSHLFHLFHTLKTKRKVTFYYGGRSKKELFYEKDFRDIENKFPNFKFHLVLSDPLPEDNWNEKKNTNDKGDGFLGFVHNSVIEHHLKGHESPEDIEFYFCGPPLMNQAVLKMCDDWGVPEENVAFDDFGG
ncbi:MAG: NADH:ubiquinone reductase (Na(+)-transporting) subunit F [Flavobacteriales bacterium TMED288]|nr:NADH:ubiquinone reductase (Na(+)-transporting) subunit F [Flavobacteriales bacterium]RPG53713.1 MAG: NADH:ubiquinone reductase (Na(+)-transporting) subunit F [Flavobacteriales bacterium TMED288]|tara:strand:- start:24 stop:1319 length:1296 start_codon:yes stop_codon:yes gene_type:complete